VTKRLREVALALVGPIRRQPGPITAGTWGCALLVVITAIHLVIVASM
jgi:hypothetical protein